MEEEKEKLSIHVIRTSKPSVLMFAGDFDQMYKDANLASRALALLKKLQSFALGAGGIFNYTCPVCGGRVGHRERAGARARLRAGCAAQGGGGMSEEYAYALKLLRRCRDELAREQWRPRGLTIVCGSCGGFRPTGDPRIPMGCSSFCESSNLQKEIDALLAGVAE